MKRYLSIGLYSCTVVLFVGLSQVVAQDGTILDIPFYDRCENAGSYTEEWLKQDRFRVANLEARRKHLALMTQEQRSRISDFEEFPNFFQTCGFGFHEELAKVRKDGKVGFINQTGEIVIPLKFVDATRFSEGLAATEIENGKWGFIDRSGKIVIEAKFDWALRFSEGRALIQIGQKWGFIDKTGTIVVPASYEHAWPFSEGLAAVQVLGLDPISRIKDSLMTGYVDRMGKLIIDHKFGGSGSFVNGKALISKSVKHPQKGGYYTACFWINKTGKIIGNELDSCNQPSDLELEKQDVDVIIDYDYRTGYRRSDGMVLWIPTK